MVDAAPFRALRYDPAVAGPPAATSAPAYDDLERFTYAHHRTASPYTVLELLAESGHGGGPGDYAAASATYERWRRTGVLTVDERPAFYRYEEHELLHGVPRVQRGVLASVDVTDPHVLAHERVDPARVQRRVNRLRAVPADLSPVFAFFPAGAGGLRRLLAQPPSRPPLAAFTDAAGVDHRIWAIDEGDDVETVRAALDEVEVVIADGHHRHAAAVALHALVPEIDRTLMYLVDAHVDGPRILAVHRLVRGVSDAALDDAVEVIAEVAAAAALPPALDSAGEGVFGVWRRGRGRVVRARDERAVDASLPDGHSSAWRGLDAARLDHGLLPILGAVDCRYRSDVVAAAEEADDADATLFVLRPATLAAVTACAEAGDPMPAKSTWFRPKPRTGLIMRELRS